MRISFDLDGTLISRQIDWEVEPNLKGFRKDQDYLRKGTIELFKWIRLKNHEIWIYTNSYRGFKELKRWFDECGIPVDKVINQVLHDEKKLENDCNLTPEKNPNWFDIDMHFDDSDELAQQGNVYKVDPLDLNWVEQVKQYINNHEQT